MIQYYYVHDNRPDAVSSAHWRDYVPCSSDSPRSEAMHKLLAPHNPAHNHPLHQNDKDILTCGEYRLSPAIGRGNSQAHCNNIVYQETRF